jgi:hypothetical protein
MHRILIALVALVPLVSAASHPPGPCASDPDRRKFDFWIGDWDVTTSGGVQTGKSSVQSIAEGCGLLENWTDLRGGTGKSLNTFNPVEKRWQQYWVGGGTTWTTTYDFYYHRRK